MIISELRGRIGNALFNIAAGLYLSKLNNTDFAIKLHPKARHKYYTEEIFPYEFFKDFTYIDEYPNNDFIKTSNKDIKVTSLTDFPNNPNIILDTYILGKNFVDYNTIKEIYKPSKLLTEEIKDIYNPTDKSLSINVRRGDFLYQCNIDKGWQSMSAEWYNKGIELLDYKYDKIFITSDDLEWCENNIKYDNVVFINKESENPKIFLDLFLASFCKDNIISASTFSWWGAYLNNNPNKRVIMPYPWNTLENNMRNKIYYTDNTIKLNANI